MGMNNRPRLRLYVLLTLLAASLVALSQRAALQVWAYGYGERTGKLLSAPAPELPAGLKSLDGAPAQLLPLRGRVVLLHFFTRACGNCKTMLPRYSRLADQHAAQGLVVLGVHTPETEGEADEAALRAFVRERSIRWRVIPDTNQRAWDRYGIQAWPTALLIDRAGVLRELFIGDDHDQDLSAAVQRLLRDR